jgi:hypothetical protein
MLALLGILVFVILEGMPSAVRFLLSGLAVLLFAAGGVASLYLTYGALRAYIVRRPLHF